MADLAQIERALRAADAAGNTEDARQLAQAYATAKAQQAPAQQPMAAPPQPVSPVADTIRSVPGGLAKGINALVGLPGDVENLLNTGADTALGMFGMDPRKIAVQQQLRKDRIGLPTSSGLNNAVSTPFGGYYVPQTKPGQYAETIASFAPNALAPGSVAARLARVAVPAVASETAGQVTKGTKIEPYARAAGALAGGIGQGMAEGAIASRGIKTPTLEELGQAKDAAYKAADSAGVVINPQSFQKFASDLGSDITKNNVVQADIHPQTLAALRTIQEESAAGAPISLGRADAIRKAVNGAIGNAVRNGNNDDVRIAEQVKYGLDKYLDSITPADTLAGDVSAAVPILKDARALARREFKGEEIQQLIDVAKNRASTNYSASGEEQAIRAQFMQLNEKLIKNKGLANSFSEAEREAIRKVAHGGPVENTLRYFGKLTPTGIVSATGGAYLGGLFGGGAGASAGAGLGVLAAPTLGAISRSGATALTNRNAQLAADLMRRGSALPAGQPTPALLADILLSQQGAHR